MQAVTQGKQMTAHAKSRTDGKGRSMVGRPVMNLRRGTMLTAKFSDIGAVFIHAQAIDESLEDARLNAIADERANGPFVSVSLDDL